MTLIPPFSTAVVSPPFAGSGTTGLVPDPVTENGYFLRDDGTWAPIVLPSELGVIYAGTVSSGTYITDVSLGNEVQITIDADTVFAAPLNPTDGKGMAWWITQGGGGSLTLAAGAGGFVVPPEILVEQSPDLGTVDLLAAVYNEAVDRWRVTAFTKGYST